MHLLLGLRPPQQPLSDAALMLAIRKGEVEPFRQLYRRHYAAVQAYAFQCMVGPLQAQEVTAHVFAGLLQQILAGESFVERRHPGCLRPHLLGNVRTTAITSWHQEPETLSPDFRDWVAAGSRWPWGDDGQLALAFERLPMSAQRLLWHSVVDRDAPALTARITGLPPHAVPDACDQARSALRQARTDLYLERLELQDCREAIRRLAQRPEVPPEKELAAHLRACSACMSVYKDVTRLDRQLEAQLPVRLLGWWTGEPYLRAKAAIPVPLNEPAFLARLVESLRADAPAQPAHRPPAPTTAAATANTANTSSTVPGRHRRDRRPLPFPHSGATVAIGGFLAGVGVGMLLLTSCQEQPGQQRPPGPAGITSVDHP
ncbi:RNA polymerase sigma factor [Streptomyces sp. NPDC001816]|uniref:RNA polymerase sigma factor n=1 Tax=Streptomyces sp. NPDC001816 TaxID=3364612 RepID=UPI0036B84DCB